MNTFYHSTRGNSETVTSKQAILTGIAPDGGLFVSDQLGDAKLDLAQVASQTYHETAAQVLSALLDDYQKDEIESCVAGAYGDNFDTSAVTPVSALGDDWLLELYHGPTCAFKDVALQMLPRLMSCARKGDGRNVMIVTATSGDTGKAALAGFTGIEGCGVTVFYPDGKVSDIQRLQMATQEGSNVAVCAIRGTFDDAQTEVKHIFANQELAQRLAERGTMLSSANSINVGRLVPQVVYYFSAYAQLVAAGKLALGDPVEFCVPTGNFGDVLAGYYAKLLGLPVSRLIVASNSNDVLTEFIRTGVYNRQRPFEKTISPSMDILVSSNLERLLYYLSDGDTAYVAGKMRELDEQGSYRVEGEVFERLTSLFGCGEADDDQTRAAIRDAWEHTGHLIDTHTAVAKCVSDATPRTAGVPRVVLSTANPYKFSRAVLTAISDPADAASIDELSDFACMGTLRAKTGVAVPPQLAELQELPELHTTVCDQAEMGGFVQREAERIFS